MMIRIMITATTTTTTTTTTMRLIMIMCLISATICSSSTLFQDYLFLRTGAMISSSSSSSLSSSIESSSLLQSLKFTPTNSIWHYQGLIRNPLSGSIIAAIEGLEYIKLLNVSSSENLQQQSASYLSRKLFFYLDKDNRTALIQQFKLNPIARARSVDSPTKEITEIVTLNNSISLNKTDDDNGSMFTARVTFPGGRYLENKMLRVENVGHVQSLEHKSLALTNFMKYVPWRGSNRWISFSSPVRSGRSQEYYCLEEYQSQSPHKPLGQLSKWLSKAFGGKSETGNPAAVMTYKRVGEAPSWFSSDRICSIELVGRRYSTITEIPEHVLQLVDENCPEFVSKSLSEQDFDSLAVDNLSSFVPWYQRLARALVTLKSAVTLKNTTEK